MILKEEIIFQRLKELDTILEELLKYQNKSKEEIQESLSLRWIIERGLLASANIIFDVSDHVLSANFGIYPETYEDSLKNLKEKNVISQELYQAIKGLGSFRNILVHDYLKVNIDELYFNFKKSFQVFRRFSSEVQSCLVLKK